MKSFKTLLCAAVAVCAVSVSAHAEDTLKIGVIAAFSGPFADYGKQITTGIKAYMQEHGDKVAGKKVELVIRDTTGPVPEVARRLAQELVVRDKVDLLAGFCLTPEALAVTDIATQGKKPMVVMNAATSIITTKSPYVVRVSHTLAQVSAPLGAWAARNGITKVATLVADYGPGIDSEAAFKKTFEAAGGQIVDSIRSPLKNPEFSPFIQRLRGVKPQAVFVFLPAGEQGVSFMKGFKERGLAEEGIKVIATGDMTDEHLLDTMGDSAIGMITSFHYSESHASPQNTSFKKAYGAVAGKDDGRPSFMAMAGYDGMSVIYKAIEKQGGKIDSDKTIDIMKNLAFESPRGPISIDPETRDIVQTVYIRKVERVDGLLQNVEFDKIEAVKDPGK